jgi:hypothetical protein
MTSATSSEGTWVALGENEAWRSKDGATWQRGSIGNLVEFPFNPELIQGPPYPRGIVHFRDAWYAVSELYGQGDAVSPVVFSSADGLTWTHLLSSSWWGFGVSALASNGTVLIATNGEFGDGWGSVFVSRNGIDWTEHVAPGGLATMGAVYAAPDGIVAVGHRSGETREYPVVWLSSDGSAWTEADPIETEDSTFERAVARTPTGSFVMLASVVTAPVDCTTGACVLESLGAWYSADGKTWRRVDFAIGPAITPGWRYVEVDLLPVTDGVLAVASTKDGWAAAVTADGRMWKQVDVIDPQLAISAAASDGESVRLFASSGVVLSGTAQ